MNYQYNYDKIDNILGKATEHGDYTYDYDGIYRLIDVDNPTLDDEAFAYDPVGNRLTAEGIAGTWTYNANNELSGYDDVTYEYDANGNMTQKTVGTEVVNYIYNTEDRLVSVEDGDGTVVATYYYDPFGRRLWKEVGGVRTCFLYADEGSIGEYDANGGEIKTYGYKLGSTWTTDPLFMKEDGNYYFYHNDHLGTPQKMTSTNGAVVWSATYSSFGDATVDTSSTIDNNLRFPGQYFDQETGLHYNYFRYYDPRTGRYLRPDPIGLRGGIDLYVYAQNNSIALLDPRGLTHMLNMMDSYDYFNKGKIPPGFPPTYDPSDYSYSTAITEIMESLWDEITGLGIGFEGHFVIGGGFDSFYCCDTNERKWRVRTAKICFGAGFGVSGGGNIIPSKSKRSSCPDGLSGFSTEFGAGPVEVGISFHKGEPVFTPGFGAGIGGKATVCY